MCYPKKQPEPFRLFCSAFHVPSSAFQQNGPPSPAPPAFPANTVLRLRHDPRAPGGEGGHYVLPQKTAGTLPAVLLCFPRPILCFPTERTPIPRPTRPRASIKTACAVLRMACHAVT